jgi:hypothetical protein
MSNLINRKLFNLTINKSKSYTLNIFGFGITSSLFSNIKQHFVVSFNPIYGLSMSFALVIKKIKFAFNNSLIKLRTKFILALSAKRVIISISAMKLTTKWTQNLSAKRIILGLAMKMRLRIPSLAFRVPKVALGLTVMVGTLNKLSTFDPQMLSALDSKTLQEMDISYSV